DALVYAVSVVVALPEHVEDNGVDVAADEIGGNGAGQNPSPPCPVGTAPSAAAVAVGRRPGPPAPPPCAQDGRTSQFIASPCYLYHRVLCLSRYLGTKNARPPRPGGSVGPQGIRPAVPRIQGGSPGLEIHVPRV